MCGLVGMANLNAWSSPGRKSWFEKALFVDELRGDHSTGVIVVPKIKMGNQKQDNPKMVKKAMPASEFLRQPAVRTLLGYTDDAAVVIGHNRYATQGAIDDSNAHPFIHGNVALVHNGTLDNRTGLTHDHEIDSCAIAMTIGDTEPENYTKVLGELEGAFCLIWFNSLERKLYLTRNDERPLYIGYGSQDKTLFWASEEWMITELMTRGNAVDLLQAPPTKIKTGVLYSTSYDPSQTNVLTLEEEKYTQKPTWTSSYWTGSNYSNINYDKYPHVGTKNNVVNMVKKSGAGGVGTSKYKAPVHKGDKIYLDSVTWEEYNRKGTGSIISVSSDHVGVSIVIPNVSKKEWEKFSDQWDWAVGTCSTMEAVWGEGTVSAIDAIKSGNQWVATVPFNSLSVDKYDLSLDDSDVEDNPGTQLAEVNDWTEDPDDVFASDMAGEAFKIENEKYVSKDEWLKLTEDGCILCGKDICIGDAPEVRWSLIILNGSEATHAPYCPRCAEIYFDPQDKEDTIH